jgi:hypothetical protein
VFELYKEEQGSFTFQDYALLMELAKGAKAVLEFGPGISTLALIEAGVPRIVSLESDPEWMEVQKEKFKDYPQVTVAKYSDTVPVYADEAAFEGDFDLAFVDAPSGMPSNWDRLPSGRKPRVRHPGMEDCSRLNTCLFALDIAPIVYLHDAYRPTERATLGRLSGLGHKITFLLEAKYGMARIERDGRGKDKGEPSLSGAV